MTRKEQELELWSNYKSGNKEAKRELIGSLKPVVRGQVNRFKNSGIPISAIELEGYRLTSHAIDTYAPEKSQLNTHVTNNLKKLSRFVTTYQNIGHIPEPRALLIGKYNNIRSNLQDDLGREPTIEELADALSVSPVEITRLQTELRKDLSMEMPSAEEDAGGFYMYVRTDETDPRLKQALEFVYFDADPIDKKILEYTFGIGGTPLKKLNEIEKELNLSDSSLKRRKKKLALELKELR